ncbi:MAG: methionyl-tRNA formyltransferase [Acidobacteria bacterium]|nr:methionyl-tRNA formyltransferase [Acidobacteriota bacterium]
MKIVFCGTPQFAVPTLKFLLTQNELEIAAVITQPDRPSGRGMKMTASPVKAAAVAAGVPVHQPERIRAPEIQATLEAMAPDCIVIIAYGQIIPARLLPIARLGWINLHASLLPKYRGAAPINWAIVNGESVSGITTMRIDAGMDTGEMLLQHELPIGAHETAPELATRMSEAGAPLMLGTLRGIAAGTLSGRAQDSAAATYAPMMKREYGRIEWSRTAQEIYDRMRGFAPWPGAFSTLRGKTCQILGRPADECRGADEPGTIHVRQSGLYVSCGGATEIRVSSVKMEGGRAMDAVEYARGARLTEGERFGNA